MLENKDSKMPIKAPELKKVEDLYGKFLSSANEFFEECKGQINNINVALSESVGALQSKEEEIARIKRKKSASEILGGNIGFELANMYNTINDMPNGEWKEKLINCMNNLNCEFENCGFKVLYRYKEPGKIFASRNPINSQVKETKDTNNIQDDDTITSGKLGFEITGEPPIVEFATRYKYCKTPNITNAEKTEPSSAKNQLMFLRDYDYIIVDLDYGIRQKGMQIISQKLYSYFRDNGVSLDDLRDKKGNKVGVFIYVDYPYHFNNKCDIKIELTGQSGRVMMYFRTSLISKWQPVEEIVFD